MKDAEAVEVENSTGGTELLCGGVRRSILAFPSSFL